uniref:Uncharacterized protein n=1 Tax=Romanomermis culicivorax TaxID=13658 RepID=A0A915KDU2_ROMCU
MDEFRSSAKSLRRIYFRMPAVPRGYGPYGVPDPPCIEHLRVGALMGGLIGLSAGGLFSLASFSKSHYKAATFLQRFAHVFRNNHSSEKTLLRSQMGCKQGSNLMDSLHAVDVWQTRHARQEFSRGTVLGLFIERRWSMDFDCAAEFSTVDVVILFIVFNGDWGESSDKSSCNIDKFSSLYP